LLEPRARAAKYLYPCSSIEAPMCGWPTDGSVPTTNNKPRPERRRLESPRPTRGLGRRAASSQTKRIGILLTTSLSIPERPEEEEFETISSDIFHSKQVNDISSDVTLSETPALSSKPALGALIQDCCIPAATNGAFDNARGLLHLYASVDKFQGAHRHSPAQARVGVKDEAAHILNIETCSDNVQDHNMHCRPSELLVQVPEDDTCSKLAAVHASDFADPRRVVLFQNLPCKFTKLDMHNILEDFGVDGRYYSIKLVRRKAEFSCAFVDFLSKALAGSFAAEAEEYFSKACPCGGMQHGIKVSWLGSHPVLAQRHPNLRGDLFSDQSF